MPNKIRDFNEYKVNPTNFLKITQPLYAYLLGLIWADGWINKPQTGKYCIEFGTTYPDSEHFIKQFLESGNWGVYKYNSKKSNEKLKCRIITNNYFMWKFLYDNDYTSKSASPEKILNKIPIDLQKYWMMGLIDGDGHILAYNGNYGIQITSCFEQDWTYLINFCIQNDICYKTKKYKYGSGAGSVFLILNIRNTSKFINLIYNDRQSLVLPRKLQVINKIITKNKGLSNLGKGIYYDKKSQKYRVYSLVKRRPCKYVSLGRFKTAIETQNRKNEFENSISK